MEGSESAIEPQRGRGMGEHWATRQDLSPRTASLLRSPVAKAHPIAPLLSAIVPIPRALCVSFRRAHIGKNF